MTMNRRAFTAGALAAPLVLGSGRAWAQAQTFSQGFSREQALAAFPTGAQAHRENVRVVTGAVRGLDPNLQNSWADAPLSVQEIQEVLDPSHAMSRGYAPNTAALFYDVMRIGNVAQQVKAWLVGAEGLIAASSKVSRRIRRAMPLQANARELRFWLNVDGRGKSRAPDVAGDHLLSEDQVSSESYEQAVGNLAKILLPSEILNGLAGVDHLIIAGSGVIGSVPFALLPAGDGRLLIDRATITIAPGLFALGHNVPPWKGRSEFSRPLIFGDPLVPADPMKGAPASLPGARIEAQHLAKLVRATAHVGEAASKKRFLESWRQSTVLYLAAHGVSDPEDPLAGGYLMLAGKTPADAYLSAREIIPAGFRTEMLNAPENRTNARLVVLSACQSGLGMLHDGGVVGLARSFNKRNIPRVVMSLWSVSDEATVELMKGFNENVQTMRPAEALRSAMLSFKKRSPDPRLWAPFSLFGTPR